MKNNIIKGLIPYFVAIIVFLIISAVYFSPQLKGDILHQGDQINYQGMSKEVVDFREQTEKEALWTNSMFGGMPAYQISINYKNLVNKIRGFVLKVFPRPAGYMFFLFIGFYILLLCFNVDPWLAIVGALGFGLSSLNILYLGAGHNAKIHAISFIPPIIGGLFYAYRKNIWIGSALVALFFSLHLAANHFQMTYYLLFLIFAVFLVEFYTFFKNKVLSKFLKASSVLLMAGILGLLPNLANILLTYEYSKYTTR
ncbi:MAG: hypothetical protein C0597_17420, partial [Marinilabiliales bacterium]